MGKATLVIIKIDLGNYSNWVNNTMLIDEWLRQFYNKVSSIMKSWFKQKFQTSQKIT